MSDLSRRGSSRPTRAQREQRIYRVVVAGSVLGLAGVVTLVLSLFGIASAGLGILLLVLAAVAVFAARRMVSG